MTHQVANGLLSILVASALLVCPYGCMSYPRASVGAAKASCCSRCRARQPGQPKSEETCACACICKGAIKETGPVITAGLLRAALGPLIVTAPVALCEADGSGRAEGWPGASDLPVRSGREIRALFGSLLL